MRGHCFALVQQLIAISRQDYSLGGGRAGAEGSHGHELPTQPAELPPEPFMEKPMKPMKPHQTLPLALSPTCLVVATAWRYPVRAPLSTGCPSTVLLQPPLALQNLLPCGLEWRLVRIAERGKDKGGGGGGSGGGGGGGGGGTIAASSSSFATPAPSTVTYTRVTAAGGSSHPAALQPAAHSGAANLNPGSELLPEQIVDFHEVRLGMRCGLQLRLPGYDWSGTVVIDVGTPSERTETVRLRAMAAGGQPLRLQMRHRASCACSRRLLQVYVSYWLVNGTGLTLQFKKRKQLTVATDDPNVQPISFGAGQASSGAVFGSGGGGSGVGLDRSSSDGPLPSMLGCRG